MATKDTSGRKRKFTSMMNDPCMLSIFETDPRPTFVVDTVSDLQHVDSIYVNPALRAKKDLLLCLNSGWGRDDEFTLWAGSKTTQTTQRRFGGVLWIAFLVDSRWKVVSTTTYTDTEGSKSTMPPRLVSPWATTSGTSINDRVPQQTMTTQLGEQVQVHESDKKASTQERGAMEERVSNLRSQARSSSDSAVAQGHLYRTTSHDSALRMSNLEMVDGSSTAGRPTPTPPDMLARSASAYPLYSKPSLSLPVTKLDSYHDPLRSDGNPDSEAYLALEKFIRLSEMVDVGFFDYSTNGKLLHANESWYALSGHPRDPELHTSLSFLDCVYPDDAEIVMSHWDSLVAGHPVTFEMRWKKPSVPGNDPILASDSQWVLAACVPVLSEDGKVKSISGCTTDINFQKHTATVALQRAEALERARASEERFARFAAVAPIAIFRFDKHKNMEFCNDRWFDMTGIPKTKFEEIAYPFGVLDDDVQLCTEAWDKATEDKAIGTVEFRLRKEWHDAEGRRGQTWVYCTFFPEFADDGGLIGLMGSMLDISHIKWAENMQKLRAEEALEAKRQQEAFIDVTSHEMRNPLSAMVQCADSIVSSLTSIDSVLESTAKQFSTIREDLDTSLDAALTILSCAAHQKRIVDDVLTLSKLDSNLLLITPVKAQPVQMVGDVIKIFEIDCKKADIQLDAIHDNSLGELGIDWLTLDPSRVVQVLINLLTNAIKFTRDEALRQITVRLSVSSQPPLKQDSKIDYVPAETITDDYGSGGEWGEGEPVFLHFEVQDTGRGLTEEEKHRLFLRFSQASPKTHVQYGGSGLGLFISRKLTEMQGGEIGFASAPQVGSTFAFYVKARRTTAPITEQELFETATDRWSSNPAQSSTKSHYNILLVEDNVVNQRVLKQQLVKLGCNVYLAGHGVEALEFLQTTDIWATDRHQERLPLDVVLMDIEMPVMGGLECTRQIRDMERDGSLRTRLPIISISANARVEQVKDARLAGVDDTITKPFRIAELLPKIQGLVG